MLAAAVAGAGRLAPTRGRRGGVGDEIGGGARPVAAMSERRPAVSILVCSRDRPARLRRALASIRRAVAAAAVEAEIVLVDDGDRPLEELPDGAADVRVARTTRRGVGAARARGVAAARGELLAFCDDDDEWTADHLTRLLAALEDAPAAALVYGDGRWGREGGGGPPERLPEFGWAAAIHTSDVLLQAAAVAAAGGFDATLTAYEDVDLWLRLGEARCRHLAVEVTLHGRHARQVSAVAHAAERERLRERYGVASGETVFISEPAPGAVGAGSGGNVGERDG